VAAAGLVERTSRRTDACVQSLSRAAHMHAVMPLFVEMGLILGQKGTCPEMAVTLSPATRLRGASESPANSGARAATSSLSTATTVPTAAPVSPSPLTVPSTGSGD
jgi:hypothetical protein